MPEIIPGAKEKPKDGHFGIPLAKWDGVQVELMSRSGMDHGEWIEKYSHRFKELLGSNPDLVNLVLTDEKGAVLEIEKRFEEMDRG